MSTHSSEFESRILGCLSQPGVPINKALLEHGHARSLPYCVSFHATVALLSICDRDPHGPKAKNIYCLAFYMRGWLTFDGLVRQPTRARVQSSAVLSSKKNSTRRMNLNSAPLQLWFLLRFFASVSWPAFHSEGYLLPLNIF